MIHYHGCPLSGGDATRLALSRRHACVSYAAAGDIAAVAELTQSFILDSGAYSAWRGGQQLDVDGYIDWAELWLKHPGCDWALAPDVIDGTEEQNDALLPNPDQRWVPIWHMHESISRLERLVHEWHRVAIGSSGQFAVVGDGKWWGRMTEAMRVACDKEGRPHAKLHGLRMLDPTVFSLLPLASADSTNVARNIGIDDAWTGSYAPASKHTRALILMEAHRAARIRCQVDRSACRAEERGSVRVTPDTPRPRTGSNPPGPRVTYRLHPGEDEA